MAPGNALSVQVQLLHFAINPYLYRFLIKINEILIFFFLALIGINLLELINDKISKFDRALRSVETPSDANKNQALITSERL